MGRDVTQRACFHNRGHRSRFATAATSAAALLSLLAASCGGGSSGNPGGGPPPPAFTNFDAPGAGTTSPQGTFGVGITTNGNLIGYFIDANGVVHGFVRTGVGAVAIVDAPGAAATQNNGTEVTAMNGSGEVVGYYSAPTGFLHSFMISPSGTMTEFDPPSSSGSTALCINDNGEIAGGVIDGNGNHGYVRASDGTFSLIDPTGNPTQVRAVLPKQINASGAVAGTYVDSSMTYHGFLRDSAGNITVLDAPSAGTGANEGTEFDDMNASGVIVGGINIGVVNGIDTTHSVIRAADGTYAVFDPPQSGAHSSFAEGINDSGVVVGEYRDANLVRHGYIRQADGTFVSFDDPEAAQLPLSNTNLGTTPQGINDNGAVAGLYTDTNGVRHAFIRQ